MSIKILDERVVDKNYNPNSENPQSGIAINEAIKKSKQNPILDYITYEIKENNTITITGCDTSISESHIIPNNIEGYLVSTIGESAFSDCNQLKNITIPNSITRIEKDAFYGCSKLKDVYYTGTEEEWYSIIIDIDLGNDWNDALFNATIHYNQVTSTKQDIIDSIDQVYSPTSKNAQSGKAVAEALSTVKTSEGWEVLADKTLDETNANVRVVSIELDKEKVNACRQFFFQLQFTTQAELKSSNIQVSLTTPYNNSVLTYVLQQQSTISANRQANAVAFSIRDEQCFYSICKKLIAAVEFNSFYETYSTISYNYDENAEVIKLRVAFNEENTFPAGTHIRLVGRR